MTPDDPRHGTNRGYNAGCRDLCCRAAHAAYKKRNRTGQTGHYVDGRGTHRRLQALAALGHSLASIAEECDRSESWAVWVLRCGKVHTATARRVADVYERLAMVVPQRPTAARDRNLALAKGWVPPLAWDDIDHDETPAAPEPLDEDFVDEMAVQRAFDGDTTVTLTNAERRAFVARWFAAGRSYGLLAQDYGYKVDRYLERGAA